MKAVWVVLTSLLIVWGGGCMGLGPEAGRRPPWTAAPQVAEKAPQFVSAVGVGRGGPDEGANRALADERARERLAGRLSAYVTDALAGFVKEHRGYADPEGSATRAFVRAVSAEVANAVLRQAEPEAAWEDAKQGAVYVLYRVPVASLNQMTLERAAVTARRINPFGPSEQAALESLRRFLELRLRARIAAAALGPTRRNIDPLAAPPPKWCATGQHPDYPPGDYMSAIGLGEQQQAARDNALAELAAAVEARMSAPAPSGTGSPAEAALLRDLALMGTEALRFTATELVAARVVEVWYDPVVEFYYALGVLDRREAAQAYSQRAVKAAREAAELLASGRNHQKAENYIPALQAYLQALRSVQQERKWQMAAVAVQAEGSAQPPAPAQGPTLFEVRARLNGLLGELSLRKVAGDKQWGALGRPLRHPLTVEACAGQKKVLLGGLPLRFEPLGPGGESAQLLTTDEHGRAYCVVRHPEASGGAVTCSIALERLAPGVDLRGVQAPAVTFRFLVRERQNTSFAVCIVEKGLQDLPAPEGIVQTAIRRALREAGYEVVDDALLPPPAAIEKALEDGGAAAVGRLLSGVKGRLEGERYLVVVTGRVQCRLLETTQTSFGKLYIVASTASICVTDVEQLDEPPVLELTAEGKDAFTGNPAEAARRARLKAADRISHKLVAELNQRLMAR